MGAGFCSLYGKIHYIEVRYIEVWVDIYWLFSKIKAVHSLAAEHFTTKDISIKTKKKSNYLKDPESDAS